jgi:hypothetical protein
LFDRSVETRNPGHAVDTSLSPGIMAVDDQKLRQSLHTRLEAAIGADEAALLMEYLPPVGWADVATKRDLDALRTDMHGAIAELKASLLMWMIPTMLASVALGATLARLTA